jgi:hypothetical protein
MPATAGGDNVGEDAAAATAVLVDVLVAVVVVWVVVLVVEVVVDVDVAVVVVVVLVVDVTEVLEDDVCEVLLREVVRVVKVVPVLREVDGSVDELFRDVDWDFLLVVIAAVADVFVVVVTLLVAMNEYVSWVWLPPEVKFVTDVGAAIESEVVSFPLRSEALAKPPDLVALEIVGKWNPVGKREEIIEDGTKTVSTIPVLVVVGSIEDGTKTVSTIPVWVVVGKVVTGEETTENVKAAVVEAVELDGRPAVDDGLSSWEKNDSSADSADERMPWGISMVITTVVVIMPVAEELVVVELDCVVELLELEETIGGVYTKDDWLDWLDWLETVETVESVDWLDEADMTIVTVVVASGKTIGGVYTNDDEADVEAIDVDVVEVERWPRRLAGIVLLPHLELSADRMFSKSSSADKQRLMSLK